MNQAELDLQIEGTQAFILADAEDLIFKRRSKVSDGSGGFKFGAPIVLSEQTGRMIPQSDRVPEISGSNGKASKPQYVLLLMPSADVQRYDQFVWRGVTWEIAELHDKPDYELKGDVIRVA